MLQESVLLEVISSEHQEVHDVLNSRNVVGQKCLYTSAVQTNTSPLAHMAGKVSVGQVNFCHWAH